MQQTKITENAEYVIDYSTVMSRLPWSVKQKIRNANEITATVIEKGLKSEAWKSRADAVKIKLNDDLWAKMVEAMPDHQKEMYGQEMVILARHVKESKADADKRETERQEGQQRSNAVRAQSLRDKARGIDPEAVGELIERNEAHVTDAAYDYKRRLEELIASAQSELDELNESVEMPEYRHQGVKPKSKRFRSVWARNIARRAGEVEVARTTYSDATNLWNMIYDIKGEDDA